MVLGEFFNLLNFFPFFVRVIQHCYICHPSDSAVSEDAGIEPRTVATSALIVRCFNHSARSRPHWRMTEEDNTRRVFICISWVNKYFPTSKSKAYMAKQDAINYKFGKYQCKHRKYLVITNLPKIWSCETLPFWFIKGTQQKETPEYLVHFICCLRSNHESLSILLYLVSEANVLKILSLVN